MASFKKWIDLRRNPWKRPFYEGLKAFRRDQAIARLNDHSSLPEHPVVFDFGGYVGDWTANVLVARPKAQVHVFEPHPRFADVIRNRFVTSPSVQVHNFALGTKNDTFNLSDASDASSSMSNSRKIIQASIVSVADFFSFHDIEAISLAKINIEGGEYDLLPALINCCVVNKIDRIHIQFHLFSKEFLSLRSSIRKKLKQTHHNTWEYPFVWEEWLANK